MKQLLVSKKTILLPLFIFLFTVTIYFSTSPGKTSFNHFVLLAQSLLEGRLDVTPYWQPHLERAVVGNKLYLPYPPMPAFIVIPYVLIAGLHANQVYASIFLGSVNVVLWYLILKKLGAREFTALWLTVFFAFSTNHWFLASYGWTWFFSHVVTVFFLLSALLLTFYQRFPLVIGMLIGSATMTRVPTIFSLAFFLFYWAQKKQWSTILQIIIGFMIITTLNLVYNYAAFGSFSLSSGYFFLPGFLEEPWFPRGLFHPSYIKQNLEVLFLQRPETLSTFPFFRPSPAGLSLFILSPFFVTALLAPLKKPLVQVTWITIILMLIPTLTHGHTGMVQLGYRRLTDVFPFLLLLVFWGTGREIRWYHQIVIALGTAVNFWGIYFFPA